MPLDQCLTSRAPGRQESSCLPHCDLHGQLVKAPPRACPHPVPGGRAACPSQAVPERPCGRAWRAPAPAAGWAEAVGWGWWQAQALSSPGHLGGRRPPPTSPATSSFPSASLLEASATLNRARHRHGWPPSPPDCSLPARQKEGETGHTRPGASGQVCMHADQRKPEAQC